ncbi:MAG: tRNA epoxyqueuosine(34) reductase QueG [Lachnospiraceae bacterium]|nr:tRNA epoxyqueuosine(34) reductase QueG [Lachnospiraceae bacterium]
MVREQIEQFCASLGLDTVGFIPCRKFEELRSFYEKRKQNGQENEFEEADIEKRIRPAHYMEGAKTIISIAFPYFDGAQKDNGFSIYTKRADYHRVVREYLDQVVSFIEGLGGKGMAFVDSNTLPERYLAYLAGNGFIGRNNMLITKHYGSYVFLGEIITDLEIRCEDTRTFGEIADYKECGECRRCYGECPTKSINPAKISPNICLSYLTQKKEITDQEISLLRGNVFGCDFCQLKCPYNEEAKVSPLAKFQAFDFMNEESDVYAKMDNRYFKEKINTTSCGWRGKNVIKRNALIRLAREGYDLTPYVTEAEYVNKYIDRIQNMGKTDNHC